MTPNHDDITDELGRALHDRADGLGRSPITLSDVKGRATRIRRRRAMAASAAVAAAVAIIVPTALVGGDLFQSSSDNGPIATNGPSPTVTKTPTTSPNTQEWPQQLDTSGLPMGAAPAIQWTQNGKLHVPDGAPAVPPHGMVVSDDGVWVLRLDGKDLVLRNEVTEVETTIGTDLGDEVTPQAVENGTAYYRVWRQGESWPEGRWWADGVEHRPEPGHDVFGWGDVTPDGYVLAMTGADDFGSCWTLQAPGGASLGETCDFTLARFSPDGQHILAQSAYYDGLGDRQLAVLPAHEGGIAKDAAVIHYLGTEELSPTFTDFAWEDDSHILAVTFTPSGTSAKGTWQILRLGLDGSVENAVEPVEATDLDGPFSLA